MCCSVMLSAAGHAVGCYTRLSSTCQLVLRWLQRWTIIRQVQYKSFILVVHKNDNENGWDNSSTTTATETKRILRTRAEHERCCRNKNCRENCRAAVGMGIPMGTVGILWEFLSGCEIKQKRVKYAINVTVDVWTSSNSKILNLFQWHFWSLLHYRIVTE